MKLLHNIPKTNITRFVNYYLYYKNKLISNLTWSFTYIAQSSLITKNKTVDNFVIFFYLCFLTFVSFFQFDALRNIHNNFQIFGNIKICNNILIFANFSLSINYLLVKLTIKKLIKAAKYYKYLTFI